MATTHSDQPKAPGSDNTLSAIRLPSLLIQIKDNSSSVLRNELSEMFDALDDHFFDTAKQAKSNNEQNLYFESMRELRVQKDHLVDSFLKEYEKNYLRLADPVAEPEPDDSMETRETINLIGDEQMEKDVAITSMVARARNDCQEELYFLNSRLDYLMPKIAVTEKNNPLDPQQICNAFQECSKMLDCELKMLLIIFKHFDQFVIQKTDNIYSAANQLLRDSGVLPKISSPIRKRSGGDTHKGKGPLKEGAYTDSEDQLSAAGISFAGLTTLLQGLRANKIALPPDIVIQNPASGDILPQEELIDSLSDLPLPITESDQPAPDVVAIRTAVQNILSSRADKGEPARLTQLDEDVINLISWLFDIILEDNDIPAEMRALISRLQIPFLKLSLRDKNFFSQTKHPGRKLLNEIARISIGWTKTEQKTQDRLYKMITDLINNILEQYDKNSEIFEQSLKTLDEFIAEEQKRAEKIENRTSKMARAQAKKSRTIDLCRGILLERLEGKKLPPDAMKFICNHWLRVLILSYLKYGKESDQWMTNLQCLDDMIWSLQKHQDEKSRERFRRILPGLRERINQGLSLIASSRIDIEERFEPLQKALSSLAEDREDEITFEPLPAEQTAELQVKEIQENKAWKEMTAVERQQIQYKSLTYAFIKKAESLPVGTWVIISNPGTGASQRCKLAAKIEDDDNYIFVNRLGFKVSEKKRKEFAYDMQRGRIKIIESGLLFDKALAKLGDNLRKLGAEPGAAGGNR
jgi:hypothetical protein